MDIINIIIITGIIVLIILFFILKTTIVPPKIYNSKTIYSDRMKKPEKALFSSKYSLTGKPDFILHTKDGLLPLEIKHAKKPNKPYFSHVMQLISYCLLIEEDKGIKPKYGFIQYKEGKPFIIFYTEEMKLKLIKTMQEMRDYLASEKCPEPIRRNKCENCSCREKCFSN